MNYAVFLIISFMPHSHWWWELSYSYMWSHSCSGADWRYQCGCQFVPNGPSDLTIETFTHIHAKHNQELKSRRGVSGEQFWLDEYAPPSHSDLILFFKSMTLTHSPQIVDILQHLKACCDFWYIFIAGLAGIKAGMKTSEVRYVMPVQSRLHSTPYTDISFDLWLYVL